MSKNESLFHLNLICTSKGLSLDVKTLEDLESYLSIKIPEVKIYVEGLMQMAEYLYESIPLINQKIMLETRIKSLENQIDNKPILRLVK